jgi:hypothetical protein
MAADVAVAHSVRMRRKIHVRRRIHLWENDVSYMCGRIMSVGYGMISVGR